MYFRILMLNMWTFQIIPKIKTTKSICGKWTAHVQSFDGLLSIQIHPFTHIQTLMTLMASGWWGVGLLQDTLKPSMEESGIEPGTFLLLDDHLSPEICCPSFMWHYNNILLLLYSFYSLWVDGSPHSLLGGESHWQCDFFLNLLHIHYCTDPLYGMRQGNPYHPQLFQTRRGSIVLPRVTVETDPSFLTPTVPAKLLCNVEMYTIPHKAELTRMIQKKIYWASLFENSVLIRISGLYP